MKIDLIKQLSHLAFFFGLSQNLSAQVQLIVTLNNNNIETFVLSDVRSVKFGSDNMSLHKNNGNISTWNISDIANYRFEGVSGLGEMENRTSKLEVYPNPASNQTMISFSAVKSQFIVIEVLDLVGRKVHTIYSGIHVGLQSYSWQVDVPKGIYFCRVVTESEIFTKSLIIK